MSSLNKLYKEYKEYCNHKKPETSEIIELVLYEDESGRVQGKRFCPTEHNPFKVETTELLKFKSIEKGAKLLKKSNEIFLLERATVA